jgi:hypothetical protein
VALEQQAFGYDPQPTPEPNKFVEILQTLLSGFADAKSAHGAALTRNPGMATNNLRNLQALRIRRENMRAEEQSLSRSAGRERAKYQLSQLDEQAAGKFKVQSEAAKRRADLEDQATKLGIDPTGFKEDRAIQAEIARGNLEYTKISRSEEDAKRLREVKKIAADHGVKWTPQDTEESILLKVAARPVKSDNKAESPAQTDTAVRQLADDLYRASERPQKRPVTTEKDGETSTRDTIVMEPTMTYEEALAQAAETYGVSGRYKIKKPAPKKGITLQSVRDKLNGASASQ